jgi:uncharacterized protein (DUF433 family)
MEHRQEPPDPYILDCLDGLHIPWYRQTIPAGLRTGPGAKDIFEVRLGSAMSSSCRTIITLEAGKRSGKPTIRGMRITVYDVLSYLASGMSAQDILNDFPYLTAEDIRACLSYAADREGHLQSNGTLRKTFEY